MGNLESSSTRGLCPPPGGVLDFRFISSVVISAWKTYFELAWCSVGFQMADGEELDYWRRL
jgi:hypothetical protein